MYKLNSVQTAKAKDIEISKEYALDVLKNNDLYLDLEKKFCKKYSKSFLNTFSFSKEGFLALLLKLNKKGTIAVSLGESEALIEAANEFIDLGLSLDFIALNKDGNVNLDELKEYDFVFISSYVMDSFIKTSLESVREKTQGKIISNGTFDVSGLSDIIYFDPFKLSGFSTHGVILYDEVLEEQAIAFKDVIAVKNSFEAIENRNLEESLKEVFQDKLQVAFKDDIYFFVNNENSLDFTLHFALKNIKARELIRTLALDEILITNGEGCSLGLSKPSRIIQAMGYDETTSRNAISLSFNEKLDIQTIEKIVNTMSKRYKQIRILNG